MQSLRFKIITNKGRNFMKIFSMERNNVDNIEKNKNKIESVLEGEKYDSLEGWFNQFKERDKNNKTDINDKEDTGDKVSEIKQSVYFGEDGKVEVIDNKVLRQIETVKLREGIGGFENDEYCVVENLEPITLYRAQSFDTPGGSYFSLEQPVDKLDTKMNSALSNIWANHGNAIYYNTREYIEQVDFPEGTKFYIGKIAGQETIGTKKSVDETGNESYPLPGGNIQIVPLAADWMDHIDKGAIKIKKFENSSGFRDFSKKVEET
jgi:hypothetical protein